MNINILIEGMNVQSVYPEATLSFNEKLGLAIIHYKIEGKARVVYYPISRLRYIDKPVDNLH